MKVHRIVSAGTPTALAHHRTPYTFHLASESTSLFPPAIPDDILGVAIAKTNDYVYTWYRNGYVSRGTTWNLVQRGEPYPFVLPGGKALPDIVDLGIGLIVDPASGVFHDRVYTWYRDGTFSIGSSRNLGEQQQAAGHTYTLPAPYTPQDLVGMAIATPKSALQNNPNRVYAWYKDGKVSSGTPTNLAYFEGPKPFTAPTGAAYADIRGMAIAGSNQWTYVWYVAQGQPTGDLAAVDWCYEIDTPSGMGQPVTITFYPIIKNVGSLGWSSSRSGAYTASVSWGISETQRLTDCPIDPYPHWFIGPQELKILKPGLTVPFHPNNEYSFAGWSFIHPDDQNSSNNQLVCHAGAKGHEFEGHGRMTHKRRPDVTLLSPYV